jgi:hypothetical protein
MMGRLRVSYLLLVAGRVAAPAVPKSAGQALRRSKRAPGHCEEE